MADVRQACPATANALEVMPFEGLVRRRFFFFSFLALSPSTLLNGKPSEAFDGECELFCLFLGAPLSR